MKTEHMINYTSGTIQEFYAQGIISQAQYEAYEYIWAALHPASMSYYWNSLLQDARDEYWKLYHVLPSKIQKILRPLAIG